MESVLSPKEMDGVQDTKHFFHTSLIQRLKKKSQVNATHYNVFLCKTVTMVKLLLKIAEELEEGSLKTGN